MTEEDSKSSSLLVVRVLSLPPILRQQLLYLARGRVIRPALRSLKNQRAEASSSVVPDILRSDASHRVHVRTDPGTGRFQPDACRRNRENVRGRQVRCLLDTQLLLWAAGVPDRLPVSVRSLLNDRANVLIFSPASLWEIAIMSWKSRTSQ